MATNFQDRFDEAIKRRGRFDVLLCMGPPTLSAKLSDFHRFVGENTATDKTKEAATSFSKLAAATAPTEGQLELYTFAEFKGLVKRLGEDIETIVEKLKKMSASDLSRMVDEDSQTATLRLRDLQESSISYDKISAKKIQSLRINRKKLEKKQAVPNQITRYVMDWSESRIPEDLK
jgi:SpoVK/Ycf46/Vps4 family AAA+-type ATPase